MTPLSFDGTDSRCIHCGAHVTGRFCRVFGDEKRRAHRCTECDTYSTGRSSRRVDPPLKHRSHSHATFNYSPSFKNQNERSQFEQ